MKKTIYILTIAGIFAACKKDNTNLIEVTSLAREVSGTYKGGQSFKGYYVSYGDTIHVDNGSSMEVTIMAEGDNRIAIMTYRDTIHMAYAAHNQPNTTEVALKNGTIKCTLIYNKQTDRLTVIHRVDSISTAYPSPWGYQFEKTDMTYNAYGGKVK